MCVLIAVGCVDPPVPAGAMLSRQDRDKATVACNFTTQIWHLFCHGNRWIGAVHNCTVGRCHDVIGYSTDKLVCDWLISSHTSSWLAGWFLHTYTYCWLVVSFAASANGLPPFATKHTTTDDAIFNFGNALLVVLFFITLPLPYLTSLVTFIEFEHE